MKYYFVIYSDESYSSAPEYFWTKKQVYVDLLFTEYTHMVEFSKVIEYDDIRSDKDFFEIIWLNHRVSIDDYNELYLMVSDHDPSVFHITTPHIQDDLACGGMTDVQYQSTLHGIVRSSLNLINISKYIKDDSFEKLIKTSVLKYVSQFILLEDGSISDSIESNNVNESALRFMGINPDNLIHCHEGIFEIVDYVMFTKMSEGIEP